MLSFLQIFSAMPNVLDSVPWPKSFLQFTFPFGLFNLDFLSALSDSSCGLSVRFFDAFLLHMCMPIICVVVVFVAWVVSKNCCVKKMDTQRQTTINQEASKALILITLLIYPGLSTKIFTVFKCKTITGVHSQLLVEDYAIACDSDGEHLVYTFLAIGFMCLYVLGIPLLMFLVLWKNKKHLHNTKSPKHQLVHFALGGLYSQCEFVLFLSSVLVF